MVNFLVNPLANLTEEECVRLAKAVQARENARKSTGPTSPEGKAISAKNAMKHGFAAANPVISMEDEEAYNAHLDSYMNRLQPIDQLESDTVRRAAIAMWKHDRIVATEAALFELEYHYHEDLCDAILNGTDPIHKLAIGVKTSAADGGFDLCRRYIASTTREHDRAIRTFYFLKSKRDEADAAAAPPIPGVNEQEQEPKPAQIIEITRKPNEPTKCASNSALIPAIPAKSPAATPQTAPSKSPKEANSPAKVA